MRRALGCLLVLLVLASAVACSSRGPRRAFEGYRDAILATDWDRAWGLLSEDLKRDFEGSPELYASEMSGLFANRDLRLVFTTTRIERVEILEDGVAALVHASHETPSGERTSRSWRLVRTAEGWRIDER